MNDTKKARTNHPVHDLIACRWSPYVYDATRPLSDDDLRSLFEAVRWAASSYNEQPWRFIVARHQDNEDFERMLSCLVPPNREWAAAAGALVLTAVSTRFARNNRENRTAQHDLGLAMGNLCLEATDRGIAVHQMAGVDLDRARTAWNIPADIEVVTAFALGYPGTPDGAGEIGLRDTTARSRREQVEFVFGGTWGRSAPFV